MTDTSQIVREFVDYVALLYHEARNVRHLIREGYLPPGRFTRLVGLPKNRSAAWEALQDLRTEAKQVDSASEAEAVFCRRLGVSLEDLVLLFQDRHWRHSSRGGNRWADVATAVSKLRDAIERHDLAAASACVSEVALMHHNTGIVGEKLRRLDGAL